MELKYYYDNSTKLIQDLHKQETVTNLKQPEKHICENAKTMANNATDVWMENDSNRSIFP